MGALQIPLHALAPSQDGDRRCWRNWLPSTDRALPKRRLSPCENMCEATQTEGGREDKGRGADQERPMTLLLEAQIHLPLMCNSRLLDLRWNNLLLHSQPEP